MQTLSLLCSRRRFMLAAAALLSLGVAVPTAHAAKKPSFRGKFTGTYKSDDGTKTGSFVLSITGDPTVRGQRVLTGKGTWDGVTQYMVGAYVQPVSSVDGFALALINKNGKGRIINLSYTFASGATARTAASSGR